MRRKLRQSRSGRRNPHGIAARGEASENGWLVAKCSWLSAVAAWPGQRRDDKRSNRGGVSCEAAAILNLIAAAEAASAA